MTSRPQLVYVAAISIRTGSNYISRLILSHPDVCRPTGPWIMPVLEGHEEFRAFHRRSIEVAQPGRVKYTLEDYAAAFGRGLLEHDLGRVEGPAARYLLQRMTGTRGLGDFHRFFPDGKLILLVRDGRDATTSYLTAAGYGDASSLRPDRAYHLWRFARRWAESGRRMLEFMAQEEDWLLVKFEEVHADPAAQMLRVADALELPVSDEWLETVRNLPVRGSGFYRAAGEDEHAGETQWEEVMPTAKFQPVGRWKERWTAADLALYRAAVGGTPARLGYD